MTAARVTPRKGAGLGPAPRSDAGQPNRRVVVVSVDRLPDGTRMLRSYHFTKGYRVRRMRP